MAPVPPVSQRSLAGPSVAQDLDSARVQAQSFGRLLAPLAATETAAAVTIDAVQAFGGYGYVRDYPVERMMRDAHLARLLIGSRAGRLESVACHFLA